jgi:hypothetical protein
MMTLFGEGGETTAVAKKAKAKRPRAENADAVQRLETAYAEQFERRWGFKPIRNYGRERKELGELERQEGWGEAAVAELLPVFFSTADRKVTSGSYSLSEFVRTAQYLRQLNRRLDPRTAENVDAARRAIGRHK